jgi:cytochrome b561
MARPLVTYSPATAVLHWVSAGAIIGAVGTVVVSKNIKDKQTKERLMFYHKSFGLLTGVLLIPRIAFALITPRPSAGPSAVVHVLLYGLTAVLAVSGFAMGYFGGKGLPFFVGTIPGAAVPSKDTAGSAYSIHKLVGSYGKFLIPVHVAGVSAQTARGNDVLSRMILPLFSSSR